LLQTTLKSISGNVVLVSSNSVIDTFLEAISVVSPFLANSYNLFPSFFIAENIGGFWSISPMNFLVAFVKISPVI